MQIVDQVGQRLLIEIMQHVFQFFVSRPSRSESGYLRFLLKEWEHQESVGQTDAATNLFEQADEVRALMNKIGAAPLNLK